MFHKTNPFISFIVLLYMFSVHLSENGDVQFLQCSADCFTLDIHEMSCTCVFVSGVGGNLVAIQASRLSTSLHRLAKPGQLPNTALHGCPNVFSTYCGKGLSVDL